MKKFFIITSFLGVLSFSAVGQIVFSEDFSTCNNSGVTTSGTDNVGGVAWSTTCPGSVAASDYFMCVGGVLEAQDTNEPEAVFSTGPINISACIGSQISFTLSETDNMEACSGTTCNSTCIDYVKVEYNLDGAGWVQFGALTCPAGLTAGNNHIQIGDITSPAGGPISWVSSCVDYGNSVEFRIACMCWAASERWRIDDITVSCNDCVLSVKIAEITAERQGRVVNVNWTTASEFNNEKFEIQRSVNGYEWDAIGELKGAGNSSVNINYSFQDASAHQFAGEVLYYRVKQYDYDGKTSFSKSRSVEIPAFKIFYNEGEILIRSTWNTNEMEAYTVRIFNSTGTLIYQSRESGETNISWTKKGFFIVEIPELNLRQKLVAQ